MSKEKFWSLWGESLVRTLSLGLESSFGPDFIFKEVNKYEIELTEVEITRIFLKIIKDRDVSGFSREITRLDCTRLSYEIHKELEKTGIRSIIVTGDYSFLGEYEYEVTEDYIKKQIGGNESSGLKLHSWLVLENYLMIDPTRMIYHEKEKFLSGELDGIPLIVDVENVPPALFYHPYLFGEEYLYRAGALQNIT